MKSTTLAACLAAAFSFTLAGCGQPMGTPKVVSSATTTTPAVDAKAAAKPAGEAKAKTEAKADAQAKAADAKPAKKADEKAELEATIKENLAKLSPEDRKLAEAQRFCAVEGEESRLGSMDVPIKLMIKDKPVFICCGGCKKQALAEADKTLAQAEAFRAKSAATK
jgi:hypothetical protein